MADSRVEIERLIASSNVRFDADHVTLSKANLLALKTQIRQQTDNLSQAAKLTERQGDGWYKIQMHCH